MSNGFTATAISIFVYYILSTAAETIHYGLDQTGFDKQQSLTLIITVTYNLFFLIFCGFLAALIFKGKESYIAGIVGILLVVINFFLFILFSEDQNLTIQLLKVVLPLHAALIGGSFGRRFKSKKKVKPQVRKFS